MYYPSRQESAELFLSKNLILDRVRAMREAILEDKDNRELIRRLGEKAIMAGGSVEAAKAEKDSDVAFERSCLYINEAMNKDAKTMTVMEYETAIKILRERSEEYEKLKKKH